MYSNRAVENSCLFAWVHITTQAPEIRIPPNYENTVMVLLVFTYRGTTLYAAAASVSLCASSLRAVTNRAAGQIQDHSPSVLPSHHTHFSLERDSWVFCDIFVVFLLTFVFWFANSLDDVLHHWCSVSWLVSINSKPLMYICFSSLKIEIRAFLRSSDIILLWYTIMLTAWIKFTAGLYFIELIYSV